MMSRNKRTLAAIGSLVLALVAVLFGSFSGLHLAPAPARLSILEGHGAPIRALAFSPDGTVLTSTAAFLTASSPTLELRVWDLQTGRTRVSHADFPADLVPLALSSDGTALAAASPDGSLHRWDTHSLAERAWQSGHQTTLSALAFSPDGRRLASANRQGGLTLWDAAGQRLWACPSGHERFVFGLAFAPDGGTLATSGLDSAVKLWDVATGKVRASLPGHTTAVPALAFAPDGRSLAAGDMNGVVKLWDVTTSTERATLLEERPGTGRRLAQEVTAVAFSPDGTALAVALGPQMQVWDISTGRLLGELRGHEGKVQCLAYSADGTRLASGSHDRTIRLWDMTEYQAR